MWRGAHLHPHWRCRSYRSTGESQRSGGLNPRPQNFIAMVGRLQHSQQFAPRDSQVRPRHPDIQPIYQPFAHPSPHVPTAPPDAADFATESSHASSRQPDATPVTLPEIHYLQRSPHALTETSSRDNPRRKEGSWNPGIEPHLRATLNQRVVCRA
jgi:hypothetical protein